MKNFNKKVFNELANVHSTHCVSIYMPTHRANEEGKGYQMDRIVLKNQLKEAGQQLAVFGLGSLERDEYLKPIHDLLEQEEFWAHQSDGLAIFLDNGDLKYFSVPIDFEINTYVNSHFNLKPLVNLLSDTKSSLLLSLSLNQVELFQVNSTEIYKIEVADLIPGKMTDTVGEDYEEKQLEGRVSSSRSGESYDSYHGHGRSNDTIKKEEALRFFQQIDNGLEKLLNEYNLPLIVACVDYLFPIYQQANSYKLLKQEHIGGNPEHEKLEDLAEAAMQIVKKENESELKQIIEDFGASVTEGKSSDNLNKVVPAAVGGRIKQLLVQANTEQWGRYEKATHSIEKKTVRSVGDTDLINLAVVETLKNGGEVLVVNTMDMPLPDSEIAAIFRF